MVIVSDWTLDLLKIIIAICAAVLTAYIVPYISQLREDGRCKGVLDMAAMAVRVAEQTITGTGKGRIKKETAVAIVSGWLKEHGVTMTEGQISDLIEAAVYGMKEARS